MLSDSAQAQTFGAEFQNFRIESRPPFCFEDLPLGFTFRAPSSLQAPRPFDFASFQPVQYGKGSVNFVLATL